MPPKHQLGRNPRTTQHPQQTKHISSSASDNHIVHSQIPSSLEDSNESPLDSHPIPVATDAFTIKPNEHRYMQISKRILQYEMKTKRINIETLSEQSHLEAHEIALLTSITSDWRLVLQDSIAIEDLLKGCISLFDQIHTDLPLSQTEMNHAVRFLQYATLHNQYRDFPRNRLLESILSEDVCFRTNYWSALLKIVCHPSNTLHMAALSFLDASISKSFPRESRFAVAVTRLLPQLLEGLKPHEIALNGTTIQFHRHIISILDKFFSISSPDVLRHYLDIQGYPSDATTLQSKKLEPIFESSLAYLRSLLTAPVCSTDTLSGYILLSDTRQFREIVPFSFSYAFFPAVQRFFGELRSDIVKELAEQLDLFSTKEAELCLHYDHTDTKTAGPWLKGFLYLLGRVSEGTQLSDLGTLAVTHFLSHYPYNLRLLFHSDDKFGLKMNDTIVSSSPLNAKSLWTLFTPTQPHHAIILLTAFRGFFSNEDSLTFEKHIWSGWFPSFVNAVDPSQLPFTADFIRFHTKLVELMREHFTKIRQSENTREPEWTDQLRGEVDEAYRAFYTHSKDYIVHLSLHPFALDNERSDKIFEFLEDLLQPDSEHSMNMTYREDARKAMDASARSSSSPPFILTSQLVCPLTDDEIIDIVDRIVALLESDSCLDDDTILRICAFRKHQLSGIYLTDLFRKAGRSTEQYLHAFEFLLSLPIDFANDSKAFIKLLLHFVLGIMPRAHLCAVRLCQSQLDRLLAPSVDFLCQFFIHPPYKTRRKVRNPKPSSSVTGFFSRFVTALFDNDCDQIVSCFEAIIRCDKIPDFDMKRRKAIRDSIPNFVEEGLQDASEFLFVKKYVASDTAHDITKQMMEVCGANFNSLYG
ncbi:hypothetical protein BLNAU_5189 [Blattamonas nauphoetae]|uniref:Uncharacterized protein n=1 Tax=Blattamonas nauphoetae TaxID=2049346 RepID=A0ABQ9Y7H9_9EUKA|nr:hypothetical protein BLNAU_5189 [Blattamonas nauphoetae]